MYRERESLIDKLRQDKNRMDLDWSRVRRRCRLDWIVPISPVPPSMVKSCLMLVQNVRLLNHLKSSYV